MDLTVIPPLFPIILPISREALVMIDCQGESVTWAAVVMICSRAHVGVLDARDSGPAGVMLLLCFAPSKGQFSLDSGVCLAAGRLSHHRFSSVTWSSRDGGWTLTSSFHD